MKMFFGFFILLSLLLVGGVVWTGYGLIEGEFPNVATLKSTYPVVHHVGKVQPDRVSFQRLRPSSWTALSEISRVAVGAIIVSEDWAFYQHKGYDPNQIKTAMQDSWEEGRFTRGASTITQQVAKNLYLTKEKSIWRKIKELYISMKLEEKVGKKRILETYLNIAEWGEGIYGIGQAAHFYFQKSPSDLTAKEGAFLAMLLPSPLRYSQSFRNRKLTDYAQETIDAILAKMTQAHYLTEDERVSEQARTLSFEHQTEAAPNLPLDIPADIQAEVPSETAL